MICVFVKVKGDNYRRARDEEPGNYVFEIGCDLFTKADKEGYKKMEEWWLIDLDEFINPIDDPVIVKVTANRVKYIFKDFTTSY